MGQSAAGRGASVHAVVFMILMLGPVTVARERLVRAYDFSSGLDASHISTMCQDPSGFLWIGTEKYVYRFDGLNFVPWNDKPLARYPDQIVHDPIEGIVLLELGALRRFEGHHLVPWEPRVEPALEAVRGLHVDSDGTLWIADEIGARARDVSGAWTTWPSDALRGQLVRQVHRAHADGAFVSTREGLWRLALGGAPTIVYKAKRDVPGEMVRAAHETADGRVFLIESRGISEGVDVLVEIRDGQPLDRVERVGLGKDVLVRGEAVWMALDHSLTRWHPTEGSETIVVGESFFGGGRLFLDAENSLWLSGPRLVQIPEPSTVAWAQRDGLPLTKVEHIHRSSEGLYTTHYEGLGFIPADGSAARTLIEGFTPGRGCVDADDRFWQVQPRPAYGGDLKIAEVHRGVSTLHDFPGEVPGPTAPCAVAADGTVWIVRGETLYRTARGGGRPAPAISLQGVPETLLSLLEASNGDLWASSETHTCRLSHESVARHAADWDCRRWPGQRAIKQLFETPAGEIWISALKGMFRWHEEAWHPVDGLPAGPVEWAGTSPRGGVWVPSSSGFLRVEEVDPDNGYAVEVVERLGVDNGLMTKSGGNVHEDADGTLWLSTVFGVLRIPGEVRDASPRIPRVEFVRFDAGNETHPVDGANHTLPSSQNDIVLGFAALTFKDRTGLRYRVRARANDPWSETRSAELRFIGLAPGHYRAEVAASLDGERWSATTATLEFTVLPPWYRTVWAAALLFLFGSAVLYGVYRARVAILLRFERQRTRIAMDLHDEMGSRLGSIRILSDLLRDDTVEAAARPSIVDQISGSAEELSSTLADIVWSLRPRVRTLRAVLDRLEVRANEFVPTGRVQVTIGVPVDDVVVSVAVCKNLLSVGSEALHNAVRHGAADRLRICLDRATGREFELRVADNGSGFDAEASSGDGLGLVSMRTRVEEIGGSLTIDSTPGEGTTVTVRFAPREYRT